MKQTKATTKEGWITISKLYLSGELEITQNNKKLNEERYILFNKEEMEKLKKLLT